MSVEIAVFHHVLSLKPPALRMYGSAKYILNKKECITPGCSPSRVTASSHDQSRTAKAL